MQRHSVAQIISSGGLYGAERVLLELAKFLAAQGWDSHVLAMDSPGAKDVAREAQREGLRTAVFTGSSYAMSRALRRYVAEQRLDLIHSHGYRPDITVAMARLCQRVARVATCHTWYRETWKMKLYELLDKAALRYFDRIVAVSPELQDEIMHAGIDKSAVSLIHNGMDFTAGGNDERERVRAEFGFSPDDKLLLRVGRLAPAKGNHVLLRALASLSAGNYKLVFAGDGEERAALEQLARELSLTGRVVFTGFRSDVDRLLAAADVFIISSLKEGLPMVLLEAMAAKRPIVTTAVGAIPQVIAHGRNGLLVEPGDAAALTSAIADVLASPQRGRELGEQAHAYYQQHHSRRAMGEKYLALYESVLRRRESA